MGTGRLIVVEGVDGAGTTTQCRLLAERLRALRVPVHTTAEPSQGPVGSLLRLMLAERVVMPGTLSGAPGWNTLALLFAADRIDHLEAEIMPNLRNGSTVICDRYDHSSVAYQSVAGDGPSAIGWIRELNRFARRPDLTLVLDVPATVAAARRRERSGAREIFDGDALQQRLCGFYAQLEKHFPGERVVHVDATRTQAEVAAALFDAVRALGVDA